MIVYKLYLFFFALKVATCSCNPDVKKGFQQLKNSTEIVKTGRLPVCISEGSGLVKSWQDGYYWTHNDSGGSPEIYMIDPRGFIFDTLVIKDAENLDWEDLAKDEDGSIYIGDFGNNSGTRKDFTIYKNNKGTTEKIKFKYPTSDNKIDNARTPDCEAFFWHQHKLYLFTKSWDKKSKETRIFEIPDSEGDHTAVPLDSVILTTAVTAADISPDGSQFALLTYGKTLLFNVKAQKIDFSSPAGCVKTRRLQTEALAYESDSSLIFTNEQRRIYRMAISGR